MNKKGMPFSPVSVTYSSVVISLTMIAIILLQHSVISGGHITNMVALMILVVIGVSLLVTGIVFWVNAVYLSLKEGYFQ